MKVNFLGDSITEGVGASKIGNCYVDRFAEITGYEVNNYGISGTRIARQKKASAHLSFDLDFQLRAHILDDTADFTFVFGGINDFSHGDAPLGEFGDKDPYTFYGGLHNLVNILSERNLKFAFILPLGMAGDDMPSGEGSKKSNAVMADYIFAMKRVLGFYGVEYIDLFHILPIPPENGTNEWFVDFVHPNDRGHRFIAETIVNYLKSILPKIFPEL